MWNSLRLRLTAILLGLAIGPLLLAGTALIQRTYASETRQALAFQSRVAQSVAVEVEALLHGVLNDLSILGRELRGVDQADRSQQLSLLLGALSSGAHQNAYEELALLDAQGQELLHITRQRIVPGAELVSHQGRDDFEQPKTTRQPYFGPVQMDVPSGGAFLIMAIPISPPRSVQVSNVLVAKIRFDVVSDLLASASAGDDQTLYIVDEMSNVVAHEDRSRNLSQMYMRLPLQASLYPGLDGTNVVMAFSDIPLGKQTLKVVAERPASNALALANTTATTVASTLAVALAMAVILGILATRQIVQPIQNLASVARKIAAGDLSSQAVAPRNDEIGLLASTFNDMTARLRNLIEGLEQRVAERTRALERRSAQLSAAARVARQAVEFQDITTLLTSITRLISEQFNFYHAGIFLLDETGEYVLLQAASSEGGQRMLARGHRLKVGEQGIVGYVAAERRPRIALDVGREAVFFNNPDLPQTRSEMALPLMARGRVIGVLDIQSTEEAAFSADDVEIMRTLADQIAIAIDNARLLAESRALVQQLQATVSLQTRQAWYKYLRRQRHGYVYTPMSVTPLGETAQTPTRETASQLRLPIRLRGQEIGSITLRRQHGMRWTEAERELVEKISTQVALALDNSRLLEETRQRALQEQTLSEISARLARSLDLDALLRTAAKELGSLPEVAEVSVFVGQENGAPPIQDARSE